MAKVFFITGTDTGIGKTYVTALLAEVFKQKYNLRVGVMKPFASGSLNDTLILMKYANIAVPKCEVTPFFTPIALAPFSAMKKQSSQRISFAKIDRCYKKIKSSCDLLLIEGIGGIAVPLTRSISLAQWVSQYRWSTIIVAHPWLGTLNHTLLTLSYLKKYDIPIEGIIINRPKKKNRSNAENSNVKVLPEISKIPVIGNIPHKKKMSSPGIYFNNAWLNSWRQ